MTEVKQSKAKVGRPMADRPEGPGTRLGNFLIDELEPLNLTNEAIARKLGYARPNIVSGWKTARTKFPLENLFEMADILNIDPTYMMALYIEQYSKRDAPASRFDEIVKMLSHLCTDDEWEIIATVRAARKNNVKPMTDAQRAGLTKLFEEPDAKPGMYTPFPIIVPAPAESRAAASIRRGRMRDFSVTELEEMMERGEETAPADTVAKRVKKRSAAAVPAKSESEET